MNRQIEEQIEKCNIATSCEFDKYNNVFHFHKVNYAKLDIDGRYLIKLSKGLLCDDSTSTLFINYNHCTAPKNEYLVVDVNQISGKMILVNSVGYNIDTKETIKEFWNGWLPINQIEILEKM